MILLNIYTGDLRRRRSHYDVIAMSYTLLAQCIRALFQHICSPRWLVRMRKCENPEPTREFL